MTTPNIPDEEAERRGLGEKLRKAREYVGFSQDEVASFLKLPRTAITNIESGQRKVEALELMRLAELYRQPVGHFTGEDEASASLPADVALLARQAAKLSVKDREELGRFADFLKDARRLRKEMMADYASAIRKGTLEATRLQRDLGIQTKVARNVGRVDVFDTIARLGVPLVFTRLDGLLGAYYREPTPGVLVTTQRPLSQQRFTAAHELGHHHLGHTPSLDDERILQRAPFQAIAGDNFQEVEAEAFAAAFLLPRWLLNWHCERQHWTDADLHDPTLVYQLALRVGISFEATVWTLHRYDVFDGAAARLMANLELKKVKQTLLRGHGLESFRDVDVWLVTERDADLRLYGGPKDLFVVRLPEHSGAGYIWQVESIDGEALAVVADAREDADRDSVGGPTMRFFTAAGRDRRAGELRFAERRPWQSAKPLKTFAVQYNLGGAVKQGWYMDQRQQHRQMLEAA